MFAGVPPVSDDFAQLSSIIVHLFIPDADLVSAQRRLTELRPGDRRADLAAAIAEATKHAKGYRVEFADEPEEPTVGPSNVVPFSIIRRPRLLGRRP
jgi:hypothetical protein